MNAVKTFFLVLFAAIIMPVFATALEFNYGTDVRQNSLFMRWPSEMQKQFPSTSFGISETRVRLHTRAYSGGISFNIALESRAGFTSSNSGPLNEGSIFGKSKPLEYWDLTNYHVDEPLTSLSSRLEQLDIRWSYGLYDINIGRQPVSLGTSHFVGILDVLAPFAPGDLDATYKPGVDAVRIRRGIGATGEAEIIAVAAKELSEGAIIGRYRYSLKGIDFEFVGGRFRRRGFGGVGWEGELKSAGIWGELAVFERKENMEIIRGGVSDAAISVVTGLDMNLPDDFKLGGSIMYQDFGARDTEELAEVYEDAPFKEGWAFLGSAAYGVFTLHRELHPLVQSDIACIINLIDNSTLWQPRITVNTGDNSDLSFYSWFGTGKQPVSNGADVSIRSEFGGMPDGVGFYARWFF